MSLQNLSIRRKLILITMLTSSIALLLSSASFLIYDLISFRHLLTQDLTTQAEIIGYNSAAAMAFKDEPAATATLSALMVKGDIVAAVLYSPDGQMFAQYFRNDKTLPAFLPSRSQEKGYRFEGRYLEVWHDVTLNGERLGTLFLQSDMRQWSTRAKRYASICLVFVLISGFLAFLVSSKLQKVISGPIVHLEDTMRMVSAHKNYEVRAVKAYADEIGSLIDGFNTMLSDIQHRDTALRGANEELQTRTRELEEEISHRKQAQDELLKAKYVAEEASRVLDLSKIEAGKMSLHLETFDVSGMIEEIVTTLQPAIEKNRNTLRVHLAEDVGMMQADITKVRQILFNLLSNACKFTDHGTISVDVDQSTEQGQDWLRFRVTDTGIQHCEALMRSYRQEHESWKKRFLTASRPRTSCSRQSMWPRKQAASQPGEGSSFTVHIPAQVKLEAVGPVQAEGDSDASDAIVEVKTGRDTILVIDDDAAVRELMSRFVGKLGFNVLTVASGEEGLRLAKQVRPVLITLDVVMPGCDGWSVLSKMKADSELSKIPVIMVTIVDNEPRGLDLGASNYLIKPVDRERLAVLIEKHRLNRFTTITRTNAVPVSRLSHGHKHGKVDAEVSGRESHAKNLTSRR